MKSLGSIICITGLFIIICGCTSGNISDTHFVALKFTIMDNGTIISGNPPMIEGAQPPISFFDITEQFNSANYPASYPPKNDSLKILVGEINTKSTMVRQITSLDNVIGIYNLPYKMGPELTINNVDNTGTVEISYQNQSIKILIGVAWTSPIISMRNETITKTVPTIGGTNYTYTVHYERAWIIENKGFVNK